MRWTQRSVRRALAVADGEAVWFWRPNAGAKFATTPTRRADDGGTAGPREEREISRKTIAWGMPDVSGASAVNTGVHTQLTLCAHQAAGALGTRHSPRPLFFRGTRRAAARGLHGLRGRRRVWMLKFHSLRSKARRHILGCHRPRRRAIQYSETSVIDPRRRGVLDPPMRGGRRSARGTARRCKASFLTVLPWWPHGSRRAKTRSSP
jgi:hypothetical protein